MCIRDSPLSFPAYLRYVGNITLFAKTDIVVAEDKAQKLFFQLLTPLSHIGGLTNGNIILKTVDIRSSSVGVGDSSSTFLHPFLVRRIRPIVHQTAMNRLYDRRSVTAKHKSENGRRTVDKFVAWPLGGR